MNEGCAQDLAHIIEQMITLYVELHFYNSHQHSKEDDVKHIAEDIIKLRNELIERLMVSVPNTPAGPG